MIKLALTRLSRCGSCLDGRKCWAADPKSRKKLKGVVAWSEAGLGVHDGRLQSGTKLLERVPLVVRATCWWGMRKVRTGWAGASGGEAVWRCGGGGLGCARRGRRAGGWRGRERRSGTCTFAQTAWRGAAAAVTCWVEPQAWGSKLTIVMLVTDTGFRAHQSQRCAEFPWQVA